MFVSFGAKERKLGFVYAVRARYGPALTSSDVYGVVVMVSWPSAVSNGPEEAIVDCLCFALVRPLKRQLWIACVLPWFGRTVEAFEAKE